MRSNEAGLAPGQVHPKGETAARERRPYQPPRLERLGSVSDLTAGVGPNPGDDTPTVGSVTAK